MEICYFWTMAKKKILNPEIVKLARIAQAEKCKENFFYFVKTFWDVIIKEKPVWNWHIEYLCNELQALSTNIFERKEKLHDLLINIPPGTTKSTIVTQMWPAWLWVKDPTIRIISNSYAAEISIEHASKSKDIITSGLYKTLFPKVRIRADKSAKTNYDTVNGGARYTTSTGGAITGRHAHVIINDDPQNPKQAESDALREQAELHTKTLSSRKVDKSLTVTVTVMQRLHENDVSGYLLSKKGEKLKHIKLPAQITEKNKPEPIELQENYVDGLLDPIRLNRMAIEEAKTDLGTRQFSGQFGQTPTVEDGDIVKKAWFPIISREEFFALKSRQHTPLNAFLDTAYTDNTENDPTGIHLTCMIGNNVYLFNRIKVLKEFPELVRFIPEYLQSNGFDAYSTVRIEPKASGKSVVQVLKQQTQLNVVEIPAPIDSKKTRLYAQSPKIEAGRYILVEGPWNDEFLEEVCGFPNAAHDEDVDLMGYALDHYLSGANQITEIQNPLW